MITAFVSIIVGGVLGAWGVYRPCPNIASRHDVAEREKKSSHFDNKLLQANGNSTVSIEQKAEETEAYQDPRIKYVEHKRALATIDELELALALGREDDMHIMMQLLLDKASTDTKALQGILTEFEADPSSQIGQRLTQLLMELKDPEVEQTAQQMAVSDDPDQAKAGLNLLGGLKIQNKETLEITKQILQQATADPDVLMNAIYAMPVMSLAPQETEAVISNLANLAEQHENAGVRSSSLSKIAEWAKDADDLWPVIQALDVSRSQDDRISAVMAISKSTVVDDALCSTLIEHMMDTNELWEIRRYSAESLKRFKLNSQDYELLKQFRQENVDIQNNG
jgi:hypothetical protein